MLLSDTHDFTVQPFSEKALFHLLANEHCPVQQVKNEYVPQYLANYLGKSGLDVSTIVAEYGYTDYDYMADFAACYARCFAHYRKRCVRLHFFKRDYNESDIRRIILGDNDRLRELNDTYCGFIVSRPLPGAVVGRTVLRVFEKDACCTTFCTRPYRIDFYGLTLTIEKSLAFQMQDATIAACATVAVWCSLHQLAEKFHTPLWNPAEITRMANVNNSGLRPVPSSGLVVEQICAAFFQAKLDVEVFNLEKFSPTESLMLITAYATLGIPIILGAIMEWKTPEEEVGKHAIVVTGYHKNGHGVVDTLFAHDDGVGPFAELAISLENNAETAAPKFELTTTGFAVEGMPVRTYKPILAIIPVYNKIRIGFNQVRKLLALIDHVLPPQKIRDEFEFHWELSVNTTGEYKKLVRNSPEYQAPRVAKFRDRILFAQHPRFMWRFLLKIDGKPIIELLADATDVTRSLPFYMAAWHCERDGFRKILNFSKYENDFHKRINDARLFDLLKKSVNDTDGFCWAERYMNRLWSDPIHENAR